MPDSATLKQLAQRLRIDRALVQSVRPAGVRGRHFTDDVADHVEEARKIIADLATARDVAPLMARLAELQERFDDGGFQYATTSERIAHTQVPGLASIALAHLSFDVIREKGRAHHAEGAYEAAANPTQ